MTREREPLAQDSRNVSESVLVTVVVPAYNAVRFLGTAVESVLSQTHGAVELIVVDDGSTDGTRALAESFSDPRVSVLSGPNQGLARARNRGLERGRGAIIAFLDADDYWLPQKLTVQLSALAETRELAAVGARMRYEALSGRVYGVVGREVRPKEVDVFKPGMPCPLSSIIFERWAAEKAGGFDEDLDRAVSNQIGDMDFLAKVLELGDFRCLPQILGACSFHSGSLTAEAYRLQKMGARFAVERAAVRRRGGDLAWEEFRATYRPAFRQRLVDRLDAWYRLSGIRATEGRWGAAFVYAVPPLALRPASTARRLARALSHRARQLLRRT